MTAAKKAVVARLVEQAPGATVTDPATLARVAAIVRSAKDGDHATA